MQPPQPPRLCSANASRRDKNDPGSRELPAYKTTDRQRSYWSKVCLVYIQMIRDLTHNRFVEKEATVFHTCACTVADCIKQGRASQLTCAKHDDLTLLSNLTMNLAIADPPRRLIIPPTNTPASLCRGTRPRGHCEDARQSASDRASEPVGHDSASATIDTAQL